MSEPFDRAQGSSPSGSKPPLSDEQILHVHEHVADDKVDDGGSYKYLPLVMLFTFSGLIFYAGTYLNKFSGSFDPRIFNEHAKPKAVSAGPALDPVVYGQKSYAALCVTCHLDQGQGNPLGGIPPLAGSEWVVGSEDRVVRIILNGLKGPITVKGEQFGTVVMPPVGPGGQNWDDTRIAAVATYVRQAFGNSAPPIATDKVAEIRGKVGPAGAHDQWTEAELKALP